VLGFTPHFRHKHTFQGATGNVLCKGFFMIIFIVKSLRHLHGWTSADVIRSAESSVGHECRPALKGVVPGSVDLVSTSGGKGLSWFILELVACCVNEEPVRKMPWIGDRMLHT
jgi:hypothetical protein